jgi:hypothetical protein
MEKPQPAICPEALRHHGVGSDYGLLSEPRKRELTHPRLICHGAMSLEGECKKLEKPEETSLLPASKAHQQLAG